MPILLLVSATSFETEPTLSFLKTFESAKLSVVTCVTGVGMVNTAFELGRLNGQAFDLAINAGIAGSFGGFKNGEVVNVTSDCFPELGAEDSNGFLSIDALGFGKQQFVVQHPFRNALIQSLPETSGITVNTVHGNDESIKKITARHQPGVETMEGAAFIQAANAFGWPAVQLRAISNAVETRNKNNWNIPLAIKNLNAVVIDLIKKLDEH